VTHFAPFFRDASELANPQRLAAYVSFRLRSVKGSTVGKECSALQSLLNWAARPDIGYLDEAPTVPRPAPKAGKSALDKVRVDLTPAQVEAIIEALPETIRAKRRGDPKRPCRAFFRVLWETGLRATWIDDGRTWWEPRSALRIDGDAHRLGSWSVRVAGGVYRQFLNSFELTNVGASALVPEVRFWLPADETLAPPRARHLALELGARPAPGWEVRVEGYHKWLDRILALDYGVLLGMHGGVPDTLSQAEFVGEAEGAAYGAGVRIAWEDGRARLQAGYDWSVSERTFPSRFDGRRQPAPWNQPHAVSLQGRVPLVGGVALETDARSIFGRSWGLRRAYFDFLTLHGTEGGPQIGLPEDSELPALHQVDLGLSWVGRPWGRLAEVRAELRNAVGGEQVLDYSLRRATGDGGDTYRRVPRLHPGRRLALTLRLGF